IKKITSVEVEPPWWYPGLSVSPDERWVLYTQYDRKGSDIMLVENFR
nr:hypothetical protein [Pyrinomonadaceae bacterium]